MSRNFLTRYTAWHLRIRRLAQFIFVGAVYHNALTNCAALLCRACVDLTVCVAVGYLTLRTGFERHGRKNPLPYSYFQSCRRSLVCVRLSNKGKVGVQRGRETAGVPSFLPTAVGTASSPLRFSENSPPRQGEPANAVRAPRLSGVGKSCRLSRANRLRGSCAPVNRCRKRVPPRMGEPPARFVHPVKRAPCKSKFPKENPHAIG